MSSIEAKQLKRFWELETPSGTINGTNTSFTLAFEPLENDAVTIFKNGLLQRPTTDYTISGVNISFVTAPAVASDLKAQYIRKSGG